MAAKGCSVEQIVAMSRPHELLDQPRAGLTTHREPSSEAVDRARPRFEPDPLEQGRRRRRRPGTDGRRGRHRLGLQPGRLGGQALCGCGRRPQGRRGPRRSGREPNFSRRCQGPRPGRCARSERNATEGGTESVKAVLKHVCQPGPGVSQGRIERVRRKEGRAPPRRTGRGTQGSWRRLGERRSGLRQG